MKFLVQQQPAYVYTGGKDFDVNRPTVVFVHGAANDHSVWTLQARYFAHHGWNALALDLPGHGQSFGDAKTSIESAADWLINLLDNGNVARAALVGHSMGSLIALDAASRYASRVSRLGLIGTSVPMPVSDELLDAAINRPADAFDMLNIWGHAPQLKWGRNPTPGTSSMMAYLRLLTQSRSGVLATDLAACQSYLPGDESLQALNVPTLVIAATHDLLTPQKSALSLAARIPGCRIEVLKGAGHAMMQEEPGKVVDALKELLKA